MKKFFFSLGIFISLSTFAQPITDTATLRTYINSTIVPNGTRAITASILNRILNGYLYSWPNNRLTVSAPLSWNPTTRTLTLPGYNASNWNTVYNWYVSTGGDLVPQIRTLTINGVSQDLSANRTFNVGTVTSVDLSLPSYYTSSGPITGAGEITITPTGGQLANRVLATPNGFTGPLGLRQLVPADIQTSMPGVLLGRSGLELGGGPTKEINLSLGFRWSALTTVDAVTTVRNNGSAVGSRPKINFSGTAIGSITDDAVNDEIDIVLNGGGGGGGGDSLIFATQYDLDSMSAETYPLYVARPLEKKNDSTIGVFQSFIDSVSEAFDNYAASGTYLGGTITVVRNDGTPWTITGLPTNNNQLTNGSGYITNSNAYLDFPQAGPPANPANGVTRLSFNTGGIMYWKNGNTGFRTTIDPSAQTADRTVVLPDMNSRTISVNEYARLFTRQTVSNPTGTFTVDINIGGQAGITFTATGARTIAFSNLVSGDVLKMAINNTSGVAITLTLPANSYVAGSGAAASVSIPTGRSMLTLSDYDGTNLMFVQQSY